MNWLGEFTFSTKRKVEHFRAHSCATATKKYILKNVLQFFAVLVAVAVVVAQTPLQLHEKKVTHSRLDYDEILCLKIRRRIE